MKTFVLFLFPVMLFNSILFGGTYSGGDGSSGNPYQIATIDDLIELSTTSADWGLYFKQTADIIASSTRTLNGGEGFSPIGNLTTYFTKFTGEYDGDGHTIDGLYINRRGSNYQGLFGHTSGALVSNLGVINVDITGANYTGGLVGNNKGTVNDSYSTGNVSGSQVIGGLVGDNDGGSVNNSYSTCSVSGYYYIGGLVGANRNAISNSYSTGSVSGLSDVGGLVAFSLGGTVNNSFWDTETSGQSSSGGGTNKTKAEMKTLSTFTDAGWDFATTPIWDMNADLNNGYPFLDWQTFYETPIMVNGVSTSGSMLNHCCIGFTAQSGTVDVTFEEYNSPPQNLPEGSVAITKYWDVTNVSGGSVKLRLYYNSSLTAGFQGTPVIYHYTGGQWVELATSAEVVDGNLRYVETIDYYSSYSPVTVGDDAHPLPVELTAFTAVVKGGNTVELKWQTATEVDNYGFEIERQNSEISSQNSEWKKIGFVSGRGNSNSPKEYSFNDDDPINGTIGYRLKQIDIDGNFEYSNTVEVSFDGVLPKEFSLTQNYPNPFNPTTMIEYSLPNNSFVTLKVYDILGNEIETLVNEQKDAGNYEIRFYGNNLSSGLYIYKIQADNFTQVRKMILLK